MHDDRDRHLRCPEPRGAAGIAKPPQPSVWLRERIQEMLGSAKPATSSQAEPAGVA
jgi:hypothetical protein